jgi:hypothetical protein
MFKLICDKNDCANKDVVYYVPEPSNPSMCGGCKDDIIPIEMTQKEFDEVFDYDPFAVTSMRGA